MSFWRGSAGSLERGGRQRKNGPDHKSFRIPRRTRISPPVLDRSREHRDPGSWRLFSRASALFLPRKAPRRTEVKLRNRERKKRTAREAPASPAPRPAAPLSEESPMARKKEPEAESCFVLPFPGTEAEAGLAVKRENPRSMRRLALKKNGKLFREQRPEDGSQGRGCGQHCCRTEGQDPCRAPGDLYFSRSADKADGKGIGAESGRKKKK